MRFVLPFVVLVAVRAQSFDAASIKPSPPVDHIENIFRREPGGQRFTGRTITLKSMIEVAWHVGAAEVVGGPDWIDRDRFDVDAKSEKPSTEPELNLMMQNLLTERFHLTIQKEEKILPAYVLLVDPNGLKLKRHDPQDGGEPLVQGSFLKPLHIRLKGTAASMDYFAYRLRFYMDLPVVNQTSLPGGYDFEFAFTMVPPNSMNEGTIGHDGQPIDFSGPKIFQVLPTELGLRLEARKVPVATISIKHAERPTSN